ncbi:MAG TPA: hypothetical protein VHN74_00325 [Candidatus Angelobacter sp.]|nr:hypothetical protein [Candidatus Angelobacter sp.]
MKHVWKNALPILMLAGLCLAAKPSRWSVDLQRQYGFQPFDRYVSSAWTGQQGVLFLTPEQVIVYQVNRLPEAPDLKARNAAGGSGSFIMELRVLSARDGHLIHAFRLPTNAERSSVHALNGGRFLVRTGNILYLYSAEFTELAHKTLTIVHSAPRENWQIAVSPSRAQVVLVHSQIFHTPQFLMDGTTISEGQSKTDVEFVDPATLATTKTFSLGHTLAVWAPVDDFLITSDPAHSYSHGELGLLDDKGKWTALKSEVKIEAHDCPFDLIPAGHHSVALLGCGRVLVLTAEGNVLYDHSAVDCRFSSATATGDYLAAQCDRYREATTAPRGSSFTVAKPDHIELHDVNRRKRLLSRKFRTQKVSYAVSERGDVAIADGPTLTMLGAEE